MKKNSRAALMWFVIIGLVALSGGMLSVAPASADPIAVRFSSYVIGGSEPSLFDVKAGDPISGLFVYESTTPDADATPYGAVYEQHSPSYLTYAVGSHSFLTNSYTIWFDFMGCTDCRPGGIDIWAYSVFASGFQLYEDEIPLGFSDALVVPPSGFGYVSIGGIHGGSPRLERVPTPSSGAVLIIGLAVMGSFFRVYSGTSARSIRGR